MMEPAKERMRSKMKRATATFMCLRLSPCSWSKTSNSLASSIRGFRVYSANAAAGLGSTENGKDILFLYGNYLLISLLPSHPTKSGK